MLEQILLKIKSELPEIKHNRSAVGKTRSGKDVSYTYTDLPKLLEILDPFFQREGILFDTMEVGDGFALIQLRLIKPDGIEFSGSIHKIYNISEDYPHQRASSLTTARRLFLCGKFGIHPASDDDGNGSQGNDVKGSLGEYNASKIEEKVTAMHERFQQKPFLVSNSVPRDNGEIKAIMEEFKEYQILKLVKFDKRRYKSLEHFVEMSPQSLMVQSVNAALNKVVKS